MFAIGVLALLGSAFLAAGVRVVGKSRRLGVAERAFASRARAVSAEVLEVREHRVRRRSEMQPGELRTVYYPVVRFVTGDQTPVDAEVEWGTDTPTARVGETVEVRYDPTDPRRVVLAHQRFTRGDLAGLGAVVGRVFVGVGLLVWVGAIAVLLGR